MYLIKDRGWTKIPYARVASGPKFIFLFCQNVPHVVCDWLQPLQSWHGIWISAPKCWIPQHYEFEKYFYHSWRPRRIQPSGVKLLTDWMVQSGPSDNIWTVSMLPKSPRGPSQPSSSHSWIPAFRLRPPAGAWELHQAYGPKNFPKWSVVFWSILECSALALQVRSRSSKMVSGATLALLVLGCVVSGVVCSVEDGLPRPPNFPDAPTATYDSTPALTDSAGAPVACQWYGWANTLYDATTGTTCLDVLRKALTNATVNPPATLQPYKYYTIKRLIDATNNQSYCYQGCFNLGNSAAPAAAPSLGNPVAPPPALSSPPAVTPSVDAPPPTSSFTPAGSPPAPEPVASSFPVMQPIASPPASLLPPASPPSPPGPPGSATVNLNGGSFVAPSALLSCFVTAVALILNLAAH